MSIEAQRKRYEIIAARLAYKALHQHTLTVSAMLETANSTDDILQAAEIPVNERLITQAYLDIYSTTGTAFAKQTYDSFKKAKSIKSLGWYWEQVMQDFVNTTLGDRIAEVTRTTYEGIQRNAKLAIEKGIQEGWGADRMAQELARLQQTMEKWRALRIARTEVVSAQNKGSYEGAKSTGLNPIKVWLSSEDNRVRRQPQAEFDHKKMNGKKAAIGEKFVVISKEGQTDEIEFPGDPKGAAGNVINCRCTIIYEI